MRFPESSAERPRRTPRPPAGGPDDFQPRGALWKVVVMLTLLLLVAIMAFLATRDPDMTAVASLSAAGRLDIAA